MTEDNFLFSIVMAIYKVEDYLEEAIESVVNQTLSFEKHVQLILVNDGSPDNSAEICLKYQQKYPRNIVYIEKENGGVSSARNVGLKYLQGRYVNFMDPDDKLSLDTLHEVFNFFEENYKWVDVVSIPMEFFEGKTGNHILNYKFKSQRVIDLSVDYNCIQLSAASAFVKRKSIADQFNESLKYAEDALFLNKILLEKMKLGTVTNAKYYYRRRTSGNSAIQLSGLTKEWYSEYLVGFSLGMIRLSLNLYNEVPKYIQFLIMYDLQWRFNVPKIKEGILNENEYNDFLEKMIRVLQYIDDLIIHEQINLNIHRKLFAQKLKFSYLNKCILKKVFYKKDVLLYANHRCINKLSEQEATIEFIDISNNELKIEGFFGSLFEKDDCEVMFYSNEEIYEAEKVDRTLHSIYSLNNLVKDYYGFKVNIPLANLSDTQEISVFIKIEGVSVPIHMKFGRFSRLKSKFQNSYIDLNGNLIWYDYVEQSLNIKRKTKLQFIKKEVELFKEFLSHGKKIALKAMCARTLLNILKNINKKKIWLYMDRVDKADDNAEHLYRYSANKQCDVKQYYIIRRDTEDYQRLKKEFNVIPFGSFKHKIFHLRAEKVISSHADEWVINPFMGTFPYYQDLFKYKFIFLQHGITKDDISSWLNKYNKNIKLFVTAAKKEYNSVLNLPYGYTDEEVALVGFPRFDQLINSSKKQILIMPTWRKNIVSELNQLTGIRPYNNNFKSSLYYHNYNKLLNDSRILKMADKKGYKIIFYPHPNIQQQIKDFTNNNQVEIVEYNISYQKLFNESDLLITDYSSVAFDFAYLKKPVLYFHFDQYHFDEGYFNYEEMGFGEVCDNYEMLVERILNFMDNNCVIHEKYIERVESFYSFTDKNNCERVLNAINAICE